MNNNLTYGIFVVFLLACFIGLAVKAGFIMACVITFVLAIVIPREFYILLLALIAVSIHLTILEWLFRYWPVTLLLGLWALLAHSSQKDAKVAGYLTDEKDRPELENKTGDFE